MTKIDHGSSPEFPLVNLLKGWPSTSLLPTEAISQAAQKVLADSSVAYPGLLYGPDEGYSPLREAIAAWNTEFYQPGQAITKEHLAITGGASQNLGCMLQVFTDPIYTRNVWIVAPAYMLAFRIFQDNGFAQKMRAVPEDEDGIDIDFLLREIRKSEEAAVADGNLKPTLKPDRPYSKYYRHIIYCVPTSSNPSSRTMTLSRRKALVECARSFDALIVADDVYDQLQWTTDPSTPSPTTSPLPRLVDIDAALDGGPSRPTADGFGNAMSNGSFSKICGPGIRVGWAQGSPRFAYAVSQTGTTCSGGAPSQLASTFMTHLLVSGFVQKHIRETLQPAYRSRYATLVGAVERELVPLGVTLPQAGRKVVGGYFIWLALPLSVRALDFVARCKDEANVVVAPGTMFEVPGGGDYKFDHCIRLCFAWEDEHKMVDAVARIATVLAKMLKGDGVDEPVTGKGNGSAEGFWKDT